jgi:beta-lactamase superfamily II metal-dependent hydrolase
LFDNIFIEEIIRNTSVTPSDVRHLKSEDGMGAGIDRLIWECERNFGPPGVGVSANTNVNGLTAEVFYHNYPVDFDDENNLSLVTIFNCYGIKVIFPGDMEMSGWRKLLTRPHFCSALRSLDIFIAPHHGRISGCCDEVFPWIGQPTFVVISDKAKGYQSQETTTYYAERTRGGIFRHTNRKVLTTRSDGSMIFRFNENGIYTAD